MNTDTDKKTIPTLSYHVVISITDPLTEAQIITQKHPCLNRRDALHLLGSIQNSVDDLAQYLPGLRVAAYEVEEVYSITPLGVSAITGALPPEPASGRDAAWWAEAIGLRPEVIGLRPEVIGLRPEVIGLRPEVIRA